MFVAKKNEPFSICDGFLKTGGDMFPDRKLAKKYEAAITKNTEIIKGKLLFDFEETKCAQCVLEKILLGWLLTILFLSSCQEK